MSKDGHEPASRALQNEAVLYQVTSSAISEEKALETINRARMHIVCELSPLRIEV
jgi:hypothetical protein